MKFSEEIWVNKFWQLSSYTQECMTLMGFDISSGGLVVCLFVFSSLLPEII